MTCFIYIFSLTNRIQKGNSLHTATEDQSRAINPIVIKPAIFVSNTKCRSVGTFSRLEGHLAVWGSGAKPIENSIGSCPFFSRQRPSVNAERTSHVRRSWRRYRKFMNPNRFQTSQLKLNYYARILGRVSWVLVV